MKYAEDYIRHFLPTISDQSLQLVLENTQEKSFRKGEIITHQGEVPEYFYIIKSGIARAYILDKNKKEHTKTLYFPPSTTGPLVALVSKTPSKTVYDCLTDCTLVEFNYKRFKKQVESNHELALLNLRAMENVYLRIDERVNDLTLLNGTERYLKLQKKIPNIDNLIQQYHIASYLNITPVQLSRIRKTLYSK